VKIAGSPYLEAVTFNPQHLAKLFGEMITGMERKGVWCIHWK
jgi:hypothetical protein